MLRWPVNPELTLCCDHADTLSQWDAAAAPAQVSSSTAQAAQATYPAQQGVSNAGARSPAQHAGAFWDPQQGAYGSASSGAIQQAAQATPSTYSAQQGVTSAASSLPAQQQGTGKRSAYTAQQGVSSAASGASVQQTGQATPSAYQAQQQGANAGPAAQSQGASSAQGTLDMGSNVPSTAAGAAAQEVSNTAAASPAAAKHAKEHKAAVQPSQGQWNQGSTVRPQHTIHSPDTSTVLSADTSPQSSFQCTLHGMPSERCDLQHEDIHAGGRARRHFGEQRRKHRQGHAAKSSDAVKRGPAAEN